MAVHLFSLMPATSSWTRLIDEYTMLSVHTIEHTGGGDDFSSELVANVLLYWVSSAFDQVGALLKLLGDTWVGHAWDKVGMSCDAGPSAL